MIPLEATGVKLLVKKTPSERDLRRMERAVQVIRNRVERWLRIQYRRLLHDMQEEILDLMHIPDDAELAQIVAKYDHRQETILRQLYATIMPKVSALVVPDDTLKSWSAGMETKDLDDIDVRMQGWMQDLMGVKIRDIDHYTLVQVRMLYTRADGDLQRFQELLQGSSLFSDMRARRIAVTETTSGINKCATETAKAVSFDRPLVKIWRTTGRLNVRSTHEMMNGVRVDVNDLFQVPREDGGFDLMEYPGDSTHGATAANVVNCHCMVFTQYADL